MLTNLSNISSHLTRWTVLLVAGLLVNSVGSAQISPKASTTFTEAINPGKLVSLDGNTRPEAVTSNDKGKMADNTALDLLLVLKRSPEMQQAADAYADSVADPKSPNFHKFLKPIDFASRFGLAAQDVAAVTEWLTSYGFTVGSVSPALTLSFSGTAAQVTAAFHTELHNLEVDGKSHWANMSDPKIPAALGGVIEGVARLNDFKATPNLRPKPDYTIPAQGGFYLPLVPADLAQIYDFKPAFSAKLTGRGQTIMVVEDTDLYTVDDWTTFRKTFGLTKTYPYGALTQVHPAKPKGGTACKDPGANEADSEAAVDVEWASAAAPNAAIVLASCEDTSANYGFFIALENLLSNGDPLPNVVSVSYGVAESLLGTTYNKYVESLYQTASVAGISVFAASGDGGADLSAYNLNKKLSRFGINVSGFASTKYNVAVGGTDFADTYFGTDGLYWSLNNSPVYQSAQTYIPEIPWNDTCASELIASFSGFSETYGATGFCNNLGTSLSGLITTTAGSGGPSGCAKGKPNREGVADGTCQGRAKPKWQSDLFGMATDGVRDLPDVSMFAANGIWAHYYVLCYSDPGQNFGGAPCAGQPPSAWAGGGGTSFAAPIMGGIQALINEAAGGGYQGLPTPIYYQLAKAEYKNSTSLNSCNSDQAGSPGPGCPFNDVTLGDMNIPCKALKKKDAGLHNCYLPSGDVGVMSLTDGAYEPTYYATPGYDFATGIGTVNAYNLIKAYLAALPK